MWQCEIVCEVWGTAGGGGACVRGGSGEQVKGGQVGLCLHTRAWQCMLPCQRCFGWFVRGDAKFAIKSVCA